jgi:hypothetical protein
VIVVAIAYIIITAPLLYIFYTAVAKRWSARGVLWQGTKTLVSLVAFSILWFAILHVGRHGQELPFAYVFSSFYAVVIGGVYVAADRYAPGS